MGPAQPTRVKDAQPAALVDASGYTSTFGMSAALLILAGLLAFLTSPTKAEG
jgi:hypothetical protein